MRKCRNCEAAALIKKVIANNTVIISLGEQFNITYWQDSRPMCGTTRCLWGNHLYMEHGKVFDEDGELVLDPEDTVLTPMEVRNLFIFTLPGIFDTNIKPYLYRLRNFVRQMERKCTCVGMS